MLGEPKNQLSLTRAALSTGERAKSNFLSIMARVALSPSGRAESNFINSAEVSP